jgi:hypothetical protein
MEIRKEKIGGDCESERVTHNQDIKLGYKLENKGERGR